MMVIDADNFVIGGNFKRVFPEGALRKLHFTNEVRLDGGSL